LRLGENVDDALTELNAKCFREHRPEKIPLLLSGTNQVAARYNREGLERLPAPGKIYKGVIRGKFNAKRVPVPQTLELRIGARVMAVKNDSQGRWVNGSIGTIAKLEDKAAYVSFDKTGKTEKLETAKWESIRYSWDEVEKKTVAKVAATYEQIPLILSWAVTIHKAHQTNTYRYKRTKT